MNHAPECPQNADAPVLTCGYCKIIALAYNRGYADALEAQ